jgi:hypothetical protein
MISTFFPRYPNKCYIIFVVFCRNQSLSYHKATQQSIKFENSRERDGEIIKENNYSMMRTLKTWKFCGRTGVLTSHFKKDDALPNRYK